MNTRFLKVLRVTAGIGILAAAPSSPTFAHGGENWNDFRVNRLDDDVKVRLVQAQQEISDIIRGRSKATSWPMSELQRTRDGLIEIKELVDEVLDYYQSHGVNIRSSENLRAIPLSGRSFAASQALEACIGLIDRADAPDSQDAFVKEIYAHGTAGYLYDLVVAHIDRMDLYGALFQPGQGESVEHADGSPSSTH